MPRAPRPRSHAPRPRQTREAPVHLVYGYDNCVGNFLEEFSEAQSRKQRPRQQLTVNQLKVLRENADLVESILPPWADNTKFNVAGILRKWKRYCEEMGIPDWRQELLDLRDLRVSQKGTAITFLTFLLDTYKIKSAGIGWQYFRQWKQLYYVTTRQELPRHESNNVRNFYFARLVPRYGLYAPTLRIKTVTDSGDLSALLSFNIAYDQFIFRSERQRLDLATALLVLAYTGCRPAEAVGGEKAKPSDGTWEELFGDENSALPEDPSDDTPADEHSRIIAQLLDFEVQSRGRPKALCYEDIQLVVIRHPVTGKETLTMSITLTNHKGTDNRPKPTIFYITPTKRLIFCLVTHVVSLAILDGAFESPTLTSVEAVFGVRVSGSASSMPLRWKKEWLKRPLFRRCDGNLDSPLPYRTFHDYMTRQSLDMGYEKPIGPKDWRRNVGNTVNGQASDAVRDQVMRHNNHSNVFQDAYLSAHVKFDVQNAVLGKPFETQVLNMLSHVGHTRNSLASSDMVPDEVWERLPQDPDIAALERERDRFKAGVPRIKGSPHEAAIRRLAATIASKKATWKKMVKRQYHLYFFHCRPTWDLQRQSDGEAPIEDNRPSRDLQLPDRAILASLLCDQPDDLSPEELHRQRIHVGTSMVNLGRLQERLRPEMQGFLGTLAATASQAVPNGPAPGFDDSVRSASSASTSTSTSSSSLSPSPPPLSPSPSSPMAYASGYYPGDYYPGDYPVRPRTPSPALSNGSTSTSSSFDYSISHKTDDSRGFATYVSPIPLRPNPQLVSPIPLRPYQQHVPLYPLHEPSWYSHYPPSRRKILFPPPTNKITLSRRVYLTHISPPLTLRVIHIPTQSIIELSFSLRTIPFKLPPTNYVE